MARKLRKFIRRSLLNELVDIIRARFPDVTIDVTEQTLGRYKHLYDLNVQVPEKVFVPVTDCLGLLHLEYGNIGLAVTVKA